MRKQATFHQFHSFLRKANRHQLKLKITCSNTYLENRTRDNLTSQTYEPMMVDTLELIFIGNVTLCIFMLNITNQQLQQYVIIRTQEYTLLDRLLHVCQKSWNIKLQAYLPDPLKNTCRLKKIANKYKITITEF